MEVILGLLVLLLMSRALGVGAVRLAQPASVGELAAGILLAVIVSLSGQTIPVLSQLASSQVLEQVANLGIFFLVLLAGIEMKPKEITEHSAGSLAVALGGVLVPLVCGFGLAYLFLAESELKQARALLVGVAMSITAIPVTVKLLSELGVLHARIGETVVSAAIFDDILCLFLLAVLTAVIETGHIPDLATLGLMLAKVAAFFAITVGLGVHVYPRVHHRMKAFQATALEFSILLGVALAYALLAEALGMHWILGAFLAGLHFEPSRVGQRSYDEIRFIITAVTSGFLGPLFFASIGLRVDLGAVTGVPLFLALMIAVAFFGKLVGAGLPSLWVGLGKHDALAVGVGMNARGAVELIVIGIAYEAGLFAQAGETDPIVLNLYSALVLMAVITTLITPILLRRIVPAIPP